MASFDENGKYIKTNWKAGDKITATKLNKIEESIEAVNDNDISRHVEADARLDALEAKDVTHDKEFTNVKNLIAYNKAAAELGDYEINSRMQFLENELNEGIEEVNNVASTVDGKIDAAEANMTAQVNQGKADMEAMVAEVEAELEGLHAKDEELSEQLADIENNLSGFVNIMQYQNLVTKNTDSSGEEFDDWTNAIQTAINENNRIELPAGTFSISNPIKIRDYKIIYGNGRRTQIVAKTGMKCVLDIDNYDTSTSYTEIKNIFINGNSLADDGIRCVGFTNNSQINTMWVENCLESGVYITKAWYSKLEKMQIRHCYNGITAISTGGDPEAQTNNVNAMHFTDMYIAFIDNNGINFEQDSGWSNMISNSTVEACGNHGIYINNIISAVTCMNIYMETIEKNGYQVDKGYCLNIIGGYVNINNTDSRCIQVGNISKLIVQGLAMGCWHGDLEYMIYSLASLNDIHCIPLSNVAKRIIYYTGKFKGSIEHIMSGDYGSDHGYDMSSLRTNKVEMIETVGYGKPINVELIKGSSLNSTVDPSRIYQYIERTSISGGWGACKINLYGKVNDSSGTEKQVYEISNGYFIPTTMKFASYSTTNRPTSHEVGMVIYDSTLKKPIVWNGDSWTDFIGNIV